MRWHPPRCTWPYFTHGHSIFKQARSRAANSYQDALPSTVRANDATELTEGSTKCVGVGLEPCRNGHSVQVSNHDFLKN